MGMKWAEPPKTLHEWIMADTVDNLFRCGLCNESLVPALIYAQTHCGAASRVECPKCHNLWAFIRIPNRLFDNPILRREDMETLNVALGNSDTPDAMAKRLSFWQRALALFP